MLNIEPNFCEHHHMACIQKEETSQFMRRLRGEVITIDLIVQHMAWNES